MTNEACANPLCVSSRGSSPPARVIIKYEHHRQEPSADEVSFFLGPAAVYIPWDLGFSINRAGVGVCGSMSRQTSRFNGRIMKNNDETKKIMINNHQNYGNH